MKKKKIENLTNKIKNSSFLLFTHFFFLILFQNYETTESKLRREFERYGPIVSIKMIHDLEGNPRGYAFIEYESSRDAKSFSFSLLLFFHLSFIFHRPLSLT